MTADPYQSRLPNGLPATRRAAELSGHLESSPPSASIEPFLPGDLLFFLGDDPLSREIAWRTATWWQVCFWQRFSHVGIIAELTAPGDSEESKEPRPLLVESTTLCGQPCLWQGREVEGVQVHEPQLRVDAYPGKVWRFRLVEPLNVEESGRLSQFCRETIGEPYDRIRAGMLAAGDVRGFFHLAPTLEEWFCSEHAATALKRAGRIGQDNNCERLSPNGLALLLTNAGNVWPIGEKSQSRRIK